MGDTSHRREAQGYEFHEDPAVLKGRLDSILASINEGFFSLDNNLVVTYFNKAAEDILGSKARDVVGRHLTDEAFPEFKGSLFEHQFLEALRTGRRMSFETYFDVAPYQNWYKVGVSPCDDGISVMFQISTEYHNTINAFKVGQARFRELFDNMAAGVAVYEASSDGQTFFFRDINSAGLNILGKTKDSIVGQDLEKLFPGVEKMGLLALLRRVWRTGQAEILPVATYEDDQTPGLWLENYIFKTGSGEVIAIFKDFTSQTRAMEEIKSLARFPAENPDPVMRVANDGMLMFANQAAQSLLDAWGLAVGQAIPDSLWQQWQPVFESEQPTTLEVCCGKRKFSLNVAPIAEAGYANIYGRDVTDILIAEKEHHRVQEQLRQLRKMESIGRLAGGVAHDLNNLLTPIMGYSQLAMRSLPKEHSLYGDMEQIHQAGQRAQSLTRQLLAFGRKQLLDVSVLNLNTEVREFEKILRRVVREDIEIELNLSEPLGSVLADAGQIHQIMMNLATNAQDAMPEGGRLTIETADVELDGSGARAHPDMQPGPYVMLVVSDTGVGMDNREKEEIFEPFFTTKPPGKGTGLGLATVYGIVHQHNGGIWVYSEPDQGATFKVYLPRVDGPADTKPELPNGPVEHKGETILVVEDEQIVRDLTCEILQRHGYDILSAGTGKQAIKVSQEFDGEIHLLLTDVVMPKLNGRQLYSQLQKSRPSLAVLYMSGYTGNVIAHHGILHADTNFLEKPFCTRALTDKVRSVLRAAAKG